MQFTREKEIQAIYQECKNIEEINRLVRFQELLIAEFQESIVKQLKQVNGAIWMVNSKLKKE